MTEGTSPTAIEQGVIDALVTMGPERDEITRDATFEKLDIDSLDLVELLQIAEDNWGVKIDTEDAKDIKTVGSAIELIEARVLAQVGAS